MSQWQWPSCEIDESLSARLSGRESWVDVWCFSLAQPDGVERALEASLSAAERARARTFYSASDQRAFIVAHAYKRRLLATYLQTEPLALRFGATVAGKPFLVGQGRLSFNLSHNGRWGVLAAGSQNLGVDVESRARCRSPVEIAQRFFAPLERAAVTSLPEALRSAAFCQRWVAKEAILKAAGTGLVGGLSSFVVPAVLSPQPVIVRRAGVAYQLAGQELGADAFVAVAWSGKGVLPQFMSCSL